MHLAGSTLDEWFELGYKNDPNESSNSPLSHSQALKASVDATTQKSAGPRSSKRSPTREEGGVGGGGGLGETKGKALGTAGTEESEQATDEELGAADRNKQQKKTGVLDVLTRLPHFAFVDVV